MSLKVNGSTKLLGLIGRPLSHSLSPLIHNYSTATLGLNQIYVPLEVDLPSLADAKDFLNWAWRIGMVGMNVTLPYKEIFAEVLSSSLNSVNTIYRSSGFWQGASTDGVGFQRAVERLSGPKSFNRMVMLGNGGAAIALASHALLTGLCQHCHVLRRSAEKDQHWVKSLGSERVTFAAFKPETMAEILANSKGSTLLVQATSAPLHDDDLSSFAELLVSYNGVFADIVYGHSSALLRQAASLGIPCQDGLAMLIEQARESQRLWWGQSASYDDLSQLV